jgi:transmembrane sensor
VTKFAHQQDDPGKVDSEARDWARRLAGSGTIEERAFQRWRDSDPRHEEAFWNAWRAWQAAGEIGAADEGWREEAAALTSASRASRFGWGRFNPVRFGVPAALAASIAAAIVIPAIPERPSLSVTTPVGSNRVVELADGSRITVGAKSGIRAYISGDERRVELAAGQAFFEVAHDAPRPFVVEAGDAEIKVTGTKFDVHRLGDDVQVSVLEGRVELRRRGFLSILEQPGADLVLTAGRMSELQHGARFGPSVPAPVTPGEWRSGRLYYTDAPLSDILADAERYSGRSLRVADADMARMRLSASFRPGNIENLIRNIEAAVPLVAKPSPDGSITFVRRGV